MVFFFNKLRHSSIFRQKKSTSFWSAHHQPSPSDSQRSCSFHRYLASSESYEFLLLTKTKTNRRFFRLFFLLRNSRRPLILLGQDVRHQTRREKGHLLQLVGVRVCLKREKIKITFKGENKDMFQMSYKTFYFKIILFLAIFK